MIIDNQDSNCVFCTSYALYKTQNKIIYENEGAYAFLSYKPSNFGHSMIVVKPHIISLRDLQSPTVNLFFNAIENTYCALKKIITEMRIAM